MIHKFSRLLMTLVALFAMTAGARADWTGETYTATANENLNAITVNDDATLTINEGVTVTVTGGINVASGTLTVTGPGTLVVTGAKGNDGANGGDNGYPGGDGGVAISGNIIVQGGATVTATGGNGGNGGNAGRTGAQGGNGGNGGNAFAGTLTYKSGTVTANGGSGGTGGSGNAKNGSSGSAGKAFANDVDFTQTTGYSVTDGTSTIESVLDQTKVVISGGTEPEPPIEVLPGSSANTWTFDMPASDVVLTPQYAPVAQWATESEVALLPTAAEGIFAGTTDPIIVEGTVATGQGTVMYAVTSTNQATAPELSAFSATVPTAENIADEGADLLVWYYIQGANTPDGQEATAENTFNDSEICATPLEVSVLSNQFDITFNAANANTIEGQNGKGTVTVKTGDADAVDKTADIDENHQLKAVKMGSTVTINAKQGYKFRKVEAKKKAILVTGITLNKTATTIVIGSTETLSVTAVTPDNANDKTVTWSSDKESVVTVDANGKVTAVAAGTANITATANDGSGVSATCAVTVTLTYPIALSAVTSDYVGSVVCSDGNVYPAKTAVPDGKTAVGILGKVTETGHGLILALKNATNQNWNTINGWTSVTTYAGTTLKVLPDETARGTNLTSYTTLGSTAVSNWAVAQKSDYVAIFTNLGSTKRGNDGKTYDGNVNAYITTGVGGTALSGGYWSATVYNNFAWYFDNTCWGGNNKGNSKTVRPVLGF